MENRFYLTFFLHNGTMIEKHKASKELAICDRKLAYWERNPCFDRKKAETILDEIKRKWS
jgi:hypothetical protein